MSTTTTPRDEEVYQIGARRAAGRLTERAGRMVTPDDVRTLVDAGILPEAGTWKGNTLYDVADVDAVDAEGLVAVLSDPERRLTADQAAAHLGIRPVDFRHLVAGGLLTADGTVTVSLPHLGRRSTTESGVFRVGQLDDLVTRPELDLDWDTARNAGPRTRSPFRQLAANARTRAQAVRAAAGALAATWGVEVWTSYTPGPRGGWTLDADTSGGTLTPEQARAEIDDHPLLAPYAPGITSSRCASAVTDARTYLRPGAAVILDEETTGLEGFIVELAVIDAATGETLLDTLVRPDAPVEPGAREVHGISDEELAGAPTLADVLPRLVEVVGSRTILAYNEQFDRRTLVRHARRDGLALGSLGRAERWDCLMAMHSDWHDTDARIALGGQHRALGDCASALDVLISMAAAAPSLTRHGGPAPEGDPLRA